VARVATSGDPLPPTDQAKTKNPTSTEMSKRNRLKPGLHAADATSQNSITVATECARARMAKAAAAKIHKLSRLRPGLGIVLGTGFHHVLTELRIEKRIPYSEIPGFPPVGVTGHSGELFIGHLANTPVIVLSGRAHYYEGHAMDAVTLAVRTLAACGIQDLLLTNAAGGINRKFRPGDFMALTDHINLMGANPLRGEPVANLPRFVDLSCAYDPELRRLLGKAARLSGVRLHAGVYLAVGGPSYETPAEIRVFARLGADAVGMSTVPEVIVARQCGLRVAALSCITNLAAGRTSKPLSHAEVLATAERVKRLAAGLLKNFAGLYAKP
jgi:purine-nucleoside phosphorylase